jgi:hypothetical protein
MKAGPATQAPRWMTEVEAAAAIGVTRAALSHWRRVMDLPTPSCWQRSGSGRLMYDAAACEKWRAANVEPERSGRQAGKKAGRQAVGKKTPAGRPVPHPPHVPPVPRAEHPVPSVAGHVAAKADSERIRTRLLEIELERKRKELLPARDVEEIWAAGLTRIRRAVMAVPARVVSALAGSHGLTVEQERALIDGLVRDLDAAIAGTAS